MCCHHRSPGSSGYEFLGEVAKFSLRLFDAWQRMSNAWSLEHRSAAMIVPQATSIAVLLQGGP
ncbi:hypothetical protein ABIB17_003309 [Arthrobacter sp. UYEF6]